MIVFDVKFNLVNLLNRWFTNGMEAKVENNLFERVPSTKRKM